MSSWEEIAKVAQAELLAVSGRGDPEVARVLLAELHRLRTVAGEKSAGALLALRCPRCGEAADAWEKCLGEPASWHHGQVTHLDLSPDLIVDTPQNGG